MQPGPRVGIPVPTSTDVAYNSSAWTQYAAATRAAGGVPVEIPLSLQQKDLLRAFAECAAFILPGSPADLDPARYGEDKADDTAGADAGREACDWTLLDYAESTGKPVLGICYGLQSMNVWRGGTLAQRLNPMPVNHEAGRQVAVAHTVFVTQTSLLGGLLTARETTHEGQFRGLSVNSSHHQAVAVPAHGLVVVARCPQDGVIEAMEGRIGNATMLGVQWHPERSVEISATSRALFLWLVSAGIDAAQSKQGIYGASAV